MTTGYFDVLPNYRWMTPEEVREFHFAIGCLVNIARCDRRKPIPPRTLH